ncbi:MAG: hypothetical protein ACI8UD_004385, partial [Planctomycetota bacterium]
MTRKSDAACQHHDLLTPTSNPSRFLSPAHLEDV